MQELTPSPHDAATTELGQGRPVALVTGVSRAVGIGAALAVRLARDGFDVAVTYLLDYDVRSGLAETPSADLQMVAGAIEQLGGRFVAMELDLANPAVPDALVQGVNAQLGPIDALVMSHCESIDSSILDTTVESFDRHFAVNARAVWLLIRAYANQVAGAGPNRRIVALTSDHTAFNLPYGASKGALDRIVLAAAHELADLDVRANVINPGGIDTGWMDPRVRALTLNRTMAGRIGEPADIANLVSFLCSQEGGWINGQLLYSDGGIRIH